MKTPITFAIAGFGGRGSTYASMQKMFPDKMKVVAVEDMYSANAWEYQSTTKQTMTVGEYTVGGVTDNMYRFTRSGDNITLTVKPFYSKQYYHH
jgi:peroxiredoxin